MRSMRGISLIEVLVAVSIVGLLLVAMFALFPKQLARSRDAERKRDLQKMKVAMEEYYSDNGCYPDETQLQACGGAQLAPYLAETPCDPITKNPYQYRPVGGNACKGYRLLADLEDNTDPIIEQIQCDGPCGCGLGSEYNYAVSAGIPINDGSCNPINPLPSTSPTSSPGGGSSSPSPSPGSNGSPIYVFACDHAGVCNEYDQSDPDLAFCPATFPVRNDCVAACEANPAAYKCTQPNN